MSNILKINGTNLATTYKCFYDGSQLFRKPEKVIDTYSVPGRNGDVAISQNKFSNVTRPIKCFIKNDFVTNYNNLVNYLSTLDGYTRIETTEESDVYMMGLVNAEIDPSPTQLLKEGFFTLNVDFKPQKWLKSGETAVTVSTSSTLTNPTQQKALPLLEVTGTGSITINNSVLALAENTATTIIDCEIEDAYEGSINRNGDLTVTNGFPVLNSGANTVSVSGCTVKVYPRWWRL